VKNQTLEKQFLSDLGLTHFAKAFASSTRLKTFDISENEIGPTNFQLLMPVFKSNSMIEELNVADTNIDGNCAT
jgi:hypothetical protein